MATTKKKPAGKTPAAKKALHPLRVGAAVFIRTVTMNYTGRISAITEGSILLEDAAWIACTKRFGYSLESGDMDEVEPFCDPVAINSGHVLDITEWRHALPREAK